MSDVLKIFEQIGALLRNDHFVYSSGKHGDTYINKNDLFAHTMAMGETGKLMAEKHANMHIDTVAGPAMCGILPAHWAAYHLSQMKGKDVAGVFAERDDKGAFVFKRGYDKFIRGKNVLIVDDIATSGGTLERFIRTVQNAGGTVVGATVLVSRNPAVTTESLGVPFTPLGEIELAMYEEAECPLCKNNTPINTTVGHGKKYLEQRG